MNPTTGCDACGRRDLAECSICFDVCERDLTPCGQSFHTSCLVRWIRRSRTCPMCRADLNSPFLDRLRELLQRDLWYQMDRVLRESSTPEGLYAWARQYVEPGYVPEVPLPPLSLRRALEYMWWYRPPEDILDDFVDMYLACHTCSLRCFTKQCLIVKTQGRMRRRMPSIIRQRSTPRPSRTSPPSRVPTTPSTRRSTSRECTIP